MTQPGKNNTEYYIFNSHDDQITHFVHKAVELLQRGCVIALPTDTIYGLVAKYDINTINRLHAIKGRESGKPFILLINSMLMMENYIQKDEFTGANVRLLHRLWPGKFTFLLPKKKSLIYPSGKKIALRMPSAKDNLFFHSILEKMEDPLLAPSLNIHGQEPLKFIDDIKDAFDGLIDAVFFDLNFSPGVPSQILDLSTEPITEIRQGY